VDSLLQLCFHFGLLLSSSRPLTTPYDLSSVIPVRCYDPIRPAASLRDPLLLFLLLFKKCMYCLAHSTPGYRSVLLGALAGDFERPLKAGD